MTNGKVYQGFRDDKKVEEHWSTSNIRKTWWLVTKENVRKSFRDFCWKPHFQSETRTWQRTTTFCSSAKGCQLRYHSAIKSLWGWKPMTGATKPDSGFASLGTRPSVAFCPVALKWTQTNTCFLRSVFLFTRHDRR